MSYDVARKPFWMKVKMGKVAECWFWTGAVNSNGYPYTRLHGGGNALARRVAYEMSLQRDLDKQEIVVDNCGNRLCVNPHHMQLSTRQAVAKNNARKGEHHGAAKLTAQKVRRIRRQLTKGSKVGELAKQYGVSHVAISHIKHRRTWIDI